MKNLIFVLVALLAISTTAQTSPNFKTIKLTAPPAGSSSDDLLSIGTDKLVKKITKTSLLSGVEPSITAGTTTQYLRGDKTWQTLNKSSVGLGNVDNTSDVDKPISNLTQEALNLKANDSNVVHLTGFEIINDTKVFEADIYARGVRIGRGVSPSVTNPAQNIVVGAFFGNVPTGLDNIAIGDGAMYNLKSGYGSIAIGGSALSSIDDGEQLIAIGLNSLGNNTGGDYSIGIGSNAGRNTSTNTPNTSSNKSIFIGYDPRSLNSTGVNEIVIGSQATGAGSNTVTLGNSSIVKTVLRGTLNASGLPTFADNTAATTGGLAVGDMYRTSTGVLMIVF